MRAGGFARGKLTVWRHWGSLHSVRPADAGHVEVEGNLSLGATAVDFMQAAASGVNARGADRQPKLQSAGPQS